MKFGQKLAACRHKPWADQYLDYEHLKNILDGVETAGGDLESRLAAYNAVSVDTEFVSQLDRQVEKIVLYLLEQQGHIAAQLRHILRQQGRLCIAFPDDDERHDVAKVIPELIHEAALDLLHLIQFVDLNVTGIRKILKKHDKVTRIRLSPVYLESVLVGGSRSGGSGRRGNILPPLLQEEALAALTFTLEQTYWSITARTVAPPLPGAAANRLPPPQNRHIRCNTAPEFQLLKMGQLAAATDDDDVSSYQVTDGLLPSPPAIKSVKATVRKHVGFQSQADGPATVARLNTLAILLKISAARRRLQQSSNFSTMLAASSLMVLDVARGDGSEDDETESISDRLLVDDWSLQVSNFLNLLSTFLYMTNYYIVAPTSASYAEKLGSDPAVSGLIIGMTPVAALISTVLYSWWTSYSYKSALIFASTCSVLGNVLYAMGLPCDSLTLVLWGRLLNGFGSARSINRRYIADTFSKDDRTAASATFVTAGALGMAAGPAIASALHVSVLNPLNEYWQVENSVGWFMAAVWAVYLVFMIGYFQDPVKKHDTSDVKAGESSGTVVLAGEKRPLLDKNGMSSGELVEESIPLWKNTAVMTTFLIYFVLKLILESSLSSASTLTRFYFGWDSSFSGIYLAALGLLMLPANLGVAYLARRYDDRELMVGMQVVMLAGCLIVLHYSDSYSAGQYVFGSVAMFIGANALEGPTMSLLSKTIPKSWSKGIFNVGFLATEAGTLGRAVGDVFLTFSGAHGLEHLVNNTFGILSLLSMITLGVTIHFFDFLEPFEKDD
jgi:MFS family permease